MIEIFITMVIFALLSSLQSIFLSHIAKISELKLTKTTLSNVITEDI